MKCILSILVLLLFSLNSNSQSFYGGIIAGTTISQVDGDSYGGYHKISPLGGVFVRNAFNDKWGMTVGIEYKRKGSKEVKKNDYEITRIYNLSLDYIEVPIMVSRNIKQLGLPGVFMLDIPNDLYFDFGFSYAYLINSKEETNGIISQSSRQFRKYEIANHIGLNYRLSEHWLASWRMSYTFLLTPIREHSDGNVYWFNRGQYNHNMSFAIKYEF
ncbi:MAG: outer membrane beta-barrel protein [Bacteroidales bacterium]|nr:outer membrane beta-barrel protein [Bacteroidales bacterium]